MGAFDPTLSLRLVSRREAAMSASSIALGIVASIVAGTIAFALASLRRLPSDPAQLVVGGRSLGTIFLWFLLAGEVYTSFTFLGAAGWAYGQGAPAFYILAYGTCGYIFGYFLLPALWRRAKERGYLTGPDLFADHFHSRSLGLITGLIQTVSVIPYITLQLTALTILFSISGYGSINATLAATGAFFLITLFVFKVGLRGAAWASVVKDIVVLGAILFAGIALPVQFFGSPAAMFDRLIAIHAPLLTFKDWTSTHGLLWYISTVLLTGSSFFMGPHSIAATFSANSENTLRRNAIFLPFYQVLLLLAFFAGFAALLIVPGLSGTAIDQSFLLVVQHDYPAWVMGFIAAAGVLCALVPASALLLASGSVIARNVVGTFIPYSSPRFNETLAIRLSILAMALLSLVMWWTVKATLVTYLLLTYNAWAQLLPGYLCALRFPRVPGHAVLVGMILGIGISLLSMSYTLPIAGINPGFVALIVNIASIALITLISKPRAELA